MDKSNRGDWTLIQPLKLVFFVTCRDYPWQQGIMGNFDGFIYGVPPVGPPTLAMYFSIDYKHLVEVYQYWFPMIMFP
jgi:hypothetical protein